MILPTKSRPFDEELLRYAEGSLNEVELAHFEARLSSEPALRNDLRLLAEQAFAIGEYVRNTQSIAVIAKHSAVISIASGNKSRWKNHLSWAAVAVLFISSVVFFLVKNITREQQPAVMVEVLEISGSAKWISDDGARTVLLENGMRLSSGSLELSSETSLARLRYDDATTLSFTGVAEATFTKTPGKSLRIKRGQVTADVTPQQKETPMRIETPTALVTVIGTRFILDVEETQTSLAVSQGSVRMRRRSDSKEIEVTTGHQLTSTLESHADFFPTALPLVADAWTSDFTTMPKLTQGGWIPPSNNRPQGALTAKPFIAGLQPDGGIITHYGISWSSEPGFAKLQESTTLRMKIRVKQAAAIQLILVTRMPDGIYTGNFEANPIPIQPKSNDEWQEIQIPLTQLQMTKYEYPKIVNGSMAHAFIITSYQQDAGMEIAELSLQSSL